VEQELLDKALQAEAILEHLIVEPVVVALVLSAKTARLIMEMPLVQAVAVF
jgi:hypothetical protein